MDNIVGVRDWRDEYFDWLMTPQAYRDPATKGEFAELFNTNRMALWRLEQDKVFQAKVVNEKGRLALQHYGGVIATVVDIMNDTENNASSRVSAARLLLDHLEVPRQVQEVAESLTDEERARLLEALNSASK